MIESQPADVSPPAPRQAKPWRRLALCAIIFVGVLITYVPSVLVRTPLRRWIVDELLTREGMEVDIGQVRIGWITPAEVKDLSLGPAGCRRLLEADQVRSDRTLWNAIWQGVDVGQLSVIHPQVHIWADADRSNLRFPHPAEDPSLEEQSKRHPEARTLQWTVQNAEVWLKAATMPAETLLFRGLDLEGSLRKGPDGRELLVEPGRMLDHVEVSPDLFDGGLRYVLPILSDATWAKGELSLVIDSCLINFDDPKKSLVSGELHVHGIQAGIKNELLQVASTRLGALAAGDKGRTVHLADDSVIQFQLRDGRVWHDGVEFGLPRVSPELVVRSRGSVSLDDQLDLVIELPLPLHLVADGPIAQAMKGQSISLRATGPLSKPALELADASLLSSLLSGVGQQLGEQDKPLQSVLDGLRGLGGEGRQSPLPLRDRMQSRREEGQGGPLRRLLRGRRDPEQP